MQVCLQHGKESACWRNIFDAVQHLSNDLPVNHIPVQVCNTTYTF